MEIEKGTPVLWYDTIGHIPIRVGIPIVLTAPEAKAALESLLGFWPSWQPCRMRTRLRLERPTRWRVTSNGPKRPKFSLKAPAALCAHRVAFGSPMGRLLGESGGN